MFLNLLHSLNVVTANSLASVRMEEPRMHRRLPVYFLIDTSESMAGEPLRQVREGLEFFQTSISQNPWALEDVRLCVITFGAQARVIYSLSHVTRLHHGNYLSEPEVPCGWRASIAPLLDEHATSDDLGRWYQSRS